MVFNRINDYTIYYYDKYFGKGRENIIEGEVKGNDYMN